MGNAPCFQGLAPPHQHNVPYHQYGLVPQNAPIAYSPHVAPRITTGYWKFRGLGAPMRMMCFYVNCPEWEDKQYEVRKKQRGGWQCGEWEAEKRDLLARNPYINLPYIKNHTTGEVISQSNAVYLYLGRLFNLNGQDAREQVLNEQVLFFAHTLALMVIDLVYPFRLHKDEASFKEGLRAHFLQQLPEFYRKLEQPLRSAPTSFMVCSFAPCTADFLVWEMVDQNERMALRYGYESPLKGHALLEAYHQRFRDHERLQQYFRSEAASLEINNKMAYFK